ncbi:MAG: 2-oxoacid:acceptor oxidoreductase family protein [Acidimicrobiia bacterium]|jgi:Pyruvate/2-oxoacid:ferredoxin oxidoreductase gamma subunit
MERELLLTGIGGQGVQLAAQIVARAAVLDGREVMLFGSYGGMMRGGNTDATIVVGDGPVLAPPTVPSTWSAIVMHHDYWTFVQERLRPGSVVLVNSTVFQGDLGRDDVDAIDVPATDIAVDVGNIMAASVVMIGALSGLTGLVHLDALVDAVPQALPPYRTKHIALNQDALRAGFAAVERSAFPAWAEAVPAGDRT